MGVLCANEDRNSILINQKQRFIRFYLEIHGVDPKKTKIVTKKFKFDVKIEREPNLQTWGLFRCTAKKYIFLTILKMGISQMNMLNSDCLKMKPAETKAGNHYKIEQ